VTTKAYFLAELDATTKPDALRAASLSNAKQLVYPTVVNDVIVFVDGNDANAIHEAALTLGNVAGVKRLSVLSLRID
jgi:hypothetical protein